MRNTVLVFSLIGICTATAAMAGVMVIGRGVGRACYEETLIEGSPARNAQALAVCDEAVRDFAVDAHSRAAALVNRADILLRMKRFNEAVIDSERGIALEPGIAAAHLNRGAGLIGLERYNEAVVSLNRAIELGTSKQHLAYFDRGMAREYLGDVRGAYLDYRKATELDPTFQLAGDQLSRFTVTRQAR